MILQRSDIAGGVQPPAADERETRANECANMHVRHMFILYVIQYDKDMCASGLPVMIYSLTLHVPTPYSTGCVRAMPYLPGGGGWSLSKPTLLPHCRVSARLSASDLKRTHGRCGSNRRAMRERRRPPARATKGWCSLAAAESGKGSRFMSNYKNHERRRPSPPFSFTRQAAKIRPPGVPVPRSANSINRVASRHQVPTSNRTDPSFVIRTRAHGRLSARRRPDDFCLALRVL